MRLVLRTLADVAEEIAEEIALGTVDRDERIVVEEYETHFDWFPASSYAPNVRAVYGFGAGYLADWLGRKNAETPEVSASGVSQ